jgi:hypothetical protein
VPAGRNSILMMVSAAGDPSNVDNFDAEDSIPDWRLVPNDNNIAVRDIPATKKSGRRARR